DLARRDIDVVGTREVIVVGRTQKSEAVRQDLEHPFAIDRAVLLGLRLQNGEDQLLLTHRRGTVDAEIARELRELVDLLVLEDLEVQALRHSRRTVRNRARGWRGLRRLADLDTRRWLFVWLGGVSPCPVSYHVERSSTSELARLGYCRREVD